MFAEDLSVFFPTTDFGEAATLQGVAVNGIFDEAYFEPLGNIVEGKTPVFTCASADVPAVAHGQTLVVKGRTFKVCGVEPDGTGLVLLRLEEQ